MIEIWETVVISCILMKKYYTHTVSRPEPLLGSRGCSLMERLELLERELCSAAGGTWSTYSLQSFKRIGKRPVILQALSDTWSELTLMPGKPEHRYVLLVRTGVSIGQVRNGFQSRVCIVVNSVSLPDLQCTLKIISRVPKCIIEMDTHNYRQNSQIVSMICKSHWR